ncbi:MAG: DUF2723 domain-containing protein [Vicinamibacterales bacterium]
MAEIACACVVGLTALTLYVATLQPDFGGPEDTPKFQFLGYVLGSAHPPGYPLYVLLSHAFVQIPIRTIAYRANLFSALMAAVACVIAYRIARQIGGGRVTSSAAALALASGPAFWRSAVFAEVYSLAAAIAGAIVCLLLSWGRSARLSRLFAGAAAFALGLGNHLTIVGLAPACAVYVLLKHSRVLTPRVLTALAVIGCVGLSQYGLIVVRTRQGAPYMESRAESVPELWRVVTAERFAGERFAYGPRVLLTVHLPGALGVIERDLRVLGLVLSIAGIAALVAATSAEAVLLLGGILGLLAMVVNLSGDLQGFVTPVLALLWPFAAVGAESVRRVLVRMNVGRAIAALVTYAIALAMPVWNVASNYRSADQSGQREEGRFLRAFYSQLPDRAGVVAQDYETDMAINYMMFTGEGGPNRGIARVGFSSSEVRGALEDGRRVFTFATGATVLSTEGFRFERMTVNGPPVEEWLEWLPRGTLVAGATAHVPFQLDLSRIGHGAARPMGRLRSYEAFAVVTGTSRAQWRNGDDGLSFRPFDGVITSAADDRGARIERDGHTIALVGAGLALAAFSPDVSLLRPLEFPSGQSRTVAYQEAVYEIRGETPCAALSNSWRDVTPVFESGSWVATLHDRGSTVIEMAIAHGRDLNGNASVLLGNGAASPVRRNTQNDGTVVLSTELTRTGDYRPVFRLAANRISTEAKARIIGGTLETVTICSHRPLVPLFSMASDRTLLRPDFEAEPYFGGGWSGAERTPAGRQRRGQGRATLFLPLDRQHSYQALFELGAQAPVRIEILLNDILVGACDIAGPIRCEVTVPARLVREGVNTMTFSGREFSLHRVELSRRIGL